MNTRQKKKQFKKAHGENPPKGIVLCGECLWFQTSKPIRQQETRNLKVFIEAMTERRKKCRKRSW